MQVRRLVAAGIWLSTTTGATAMVWAATSVVAGDVTDRPAPVVAHREVVMALQTGSGAKTTPAVTAVGSPAIAPTTTAPPDGRRPVALATSIPPSEPPPSQVADPGATIPSPPTTTTTTPAVPTPTTQPPVDPTGTFSTAGGTVTATCRGYFIGLVAATPTDGYAVEVLDRGPGTVDVHFTRPGDEVRVRLLCFGGRPIRIPDQHDDAGRTSTTRVP